MSSTLEGRPAPELPPHPPIETYCTPTPPNYCSDPYLADAIGPLGEHQIVLPDGTWVPGGGPVLTPDTWDAAEGTWDEQTVTFETAKAS